VDASEKRTKCAEQARTAADRINRINRINRVLYDIVIVLLLLSSKPTMTRVTMVHSWQGSTSKVDLGGSSTTYGVWTALANPTRLPSKSKIE